MYDFFGIKIDTTKMSMEELEDMRSKVQNMLDILNHEIVYKKIANRKYKYSSNEESLT